MIEPANGLVIRYANLWAREHFRGETAGRKDRPACVQIIMKDTAQRTRVILFPITSSEPATGRVSRPVPQTEARRAGLTTPAWVIVDEFNLDELATSPHIADSQPIGKFSPPFMREIREAAAGCIRQKQYRALPRS